MGHHQILNMQFKPFRDIDEYSSLLLKNIKNIESQLTPDLCIDVFI